MTLKNTSSSVKVGVNSWSVLRKAGVRSNDMICRKVVQLLTYAIAFSAFENESALTDDMRHIRSQTTLSEL